MSDKAKLNYCMYWMLTLSKQKKEKVVKISTKKKKRGTQGCKKWNNNHIYSGEKNQSSKY